MKNIFSKVARPETLAKSVIGGLVVFAFSESLAFYAASIVAIHAAISGYQVYKDRKPVLNAG